MPNYDVAGPELKKILKKAAKDDVAFAFNPGKSEEETYFAMHILKSPSSLLKEAKSVGTGPKTAFGYSRVATQEKEFRLTCEMVVPGLAKKMKKYLKANKVSLNVVVMDSDGNILEADIEEFADVADDADDDDDEASAENQNRRSELSKVEAAASSEPQASQVPDAKALLQRFMALRDKMKVLPEAAAARLIDPFKKTAALLKENELEAAGSNIEKLEKAVALLQAAGAPPPPPPPPPNPMAPKLMQLAEMLRGQAGALEDEDRRAKIETAIERAIAQISKDEIREAAALLGKIRDLLKPTGTTPVAMEEKGEVAQAGPSRWKQAYDHWLDANDSLDKQLNSLRDAILQETGYPEFATELAEIARVGLNALTGNNRVKLMAALQVMGSGDAASLNTHGEKALSAIAAFKAYLDGNIQVDACEGNPWDVDVSIRDTLYPPLDQLSAILQGQR